MLIHSDSSAVRQALRAMAEELSVEVPRAVKIAGQLAETSAKATTSWKDGPDVVPGAFEGSTKKRTGPHTRQTIRAIVNGTRVSLRAGGAGRFLENGTSGHIIAASGKGRGTYDTTVSYHGGTASTSSKRGRAAVLRFFVNGKAIFRRSVYHPGTKPTFFLEIAAVEAIHWLETALPKLVTRAAQRHGLGR